MQIGVPAETAAGESRVAATPETVQKLLRQGHVVRVQAGAGQWASAPDVAYEAVGAQMTDAAGALGCPMVLKVRAPSDAELALMQPGAVLVGMLEPFHAEGLQKMAAAGLTVFALEAAPRITRAQGMDALSSQASVSGYKAVLLAANHLPRLFPMMMTAAGTIQAARVVVLGVGVAGLQAIATAKRLGAVVQASDVRPVVREQVESLGAKFIDVPFETAEEKEAAEGAGGYARAMPASWLARQQQEVARRVAQADVVIATALVAGRPAPQLITEEMLSHMKPGSVIVDIAAGRGVPNADGSVGGNCPLTVPGQTVVRRGVTLIGQTNLPALVAADASSLYARNVLDFLKLLLPENQTLTIDLHDDIVAACLVARDGAVLLHV
ncbi:MAG: Re/Si-specific NAD(P)(+) transhydrogenase subunit alpha [Burkholderiaceae bacterium]|jgi:NAD(P) transhydrogenase subunit alpha|nr:Re/Si-specific NAD(P)(+) transhydrogenase subunit alpha [Burkholderiaceae bacterium]